MNVTIQVAGFTVDYFALFIFFEIVDIQRFKG